MCRPFHSVVARSMLMDQRRFRTRLIHPFNTSEICASHAEYDAQIAERVARAVCIECLTSSDIANYCRCGTYFVCVNCLPAAEEAGKISHAHLIDPKPIMCIRGYCWRASRRLFERRIRQSVRQYIQERAQEHKQRRARMLRRLRPRGR